MGNIMKHHVAKKVFNRAIKSIHAGERSKASELFQHALLLDPYNLDAWLWLAALTNDPDQRIFYLNQALLLDPQNRTALDGLHALNQQHQRLQELQKQAYTSVGKQTIKLHNPFAQPAFQSAFNLPSSSYLQAPKRSQGSIKDALAQRKLVRFIESEVKKRSNSKTMSVDFILAVMERGDLTWHESVALINHTVGHTYKKGGSTLNASIEEVMSFMFFLFLLVSLPVLFAIPHLYGLLLVVIWITILVCIRAIWHYQNDQTEDEF
jgi:tetratricopeptide (TPR) repeat protein